MIIPKFQIGLMEEAKTIREHVFVLEQGFQKEFDEKDATCWQLVLLLDGLPISTGRIEEVDPETYQIERVAVEKPFRGKKVGTYTVKFLCNKAISLGARKAILLAQADKIDFYKKIGFRVIGNGEIVYEEGVPHVMMGKTLIRPKKRKAQTSLKG